MSHAHHYATTPTATLRAMMAGANQFLAMARNGDLIRYGCSREPTAEEIEDVNLDLAAIRAELKSRTDRIMGV